MQLYTNKQIIGGTLGLFDQFWRWMRGAEDLDPYDSGTEDVPLLVISVKAGMKEEARVLLAERGFLDPHEQSWLVSPDGIGDHSLQTPGN